MTTEQFLQQHYIDRHNTHSLKWDELEKRYGDPTLTSMWVADMDFKTDATILQKMIERIEHGVFGYSYIPDDYFAALNRWHERRYGFSVPKESVRFSNGLVTAINWIINGFTEKQDAVLILTPVYYPFHSAVTNNERKLVTVDLVKQENRYVMDFEAIEQAISENSVKLFVQCSPHNPVGRVWTEAELDKILAICRKHNVLVVSDEIHQDITMEGYRFVPAATVKNGAYCDNLITLNSASKTFNLAGLLHSHIIITDEKLRTRYDDYIKRINQTETNILGYVATQAGYEYGEAWLNQVCEIVGQNYRYLKQTLNRHAPRVEMAELEGTYLLMLDLRAYVKPENIKTFMQEKCGIAANYGETFGKNFAGFVRLNLATHPEVVKKAVGDMVSALTA